MDYVVLHLLIIGRELAFGFLPMDQYRSRRLTPKKNKSSENSSSKPRYKNERIVDQSTVSPLHVVTADLGALIASAGDSNDHAFIDTQCSTFQTRLKRRKRKGFSICRGFVNIYSNG